MYRFLFIFLLPFSLFCEDDTKPNGCHGPTLCHSYRAQEGAGLVIYAGVIAAQARLTGALYSHNVVGVPFEPDHTASVLRPNFKVCAGFDGGLGYRYFHDNWSCDLNYFYLKSTTKASVCLCGDQSSFVPDCIWCHNLFDKVEFIDPSDTFVLPIVSFEITHYDLDLMLERSTFYSGNYSLAAGFGLKNTWLEFCDNTHFCNVFGYYNCCSIENNGQMDWTEHDIKRCDRTDFYGIGPQIGFDSKYCITQNFAFIHDFEVALLVGRSKTCNRLFVDQTLTVAINDSYSTLSPYMGFKLGAEYSSSHRNNTLQFIMRIAYENALYFNQYNRICYDGICKLRESQNNTYSLTGLVVNVGLEF